MHWLGVRHVLRSIGSRWPLSAAIVIPIALALAIDTALFSVVYGLFLRPLPFWNPDALVALDFRRVNGELARLAYDRDLAADREALRERIEASGLVADATHVRPNASFGASAAEHGLEVSDVDSRFFPMLGLAPAVGRVFTVEDESTAAAGGSASPVPRAVVISHGLWQRMFGGTPDVLGVRELAGRRVRIVGVMGPGVKFPGETNVWAATPPVPGRPPTHIRLVRDATVRQLATIVPDLTVTPLSSAVRPEGRRNLLVVFAASALLLLLAWVQVGTLVLAGALERAHEIGVRLALGASRAGLALRFAAENAVLAAASFGLAWVVVNPLTTFVAAALPESLVRGQYLRPDARVFVFGCLVSLVGFSVLTLLPALVIRRATPLGLLHGHIADLPIRSERLRRALLVGQVTLTGVLLYLSGLTTHSVLRAAAFDYGFDSSRVVLFTPPFPRTAPAADLARFTGPDAQFEARSVERNRRTVASIDALQRTPGVAAAAAFFRVPLVRDTLTGVDDVLEFGGREVMPRVRVQSNTVSGNFVSALGATLIQGSSFDDPQHAGALDVAVVNETFARRFAPPISVAGLDDIRLNVVGQTIRTLQFRGRIVGVIRDLVYSTPAEPSAPQLFVPMRQGGAGRFLMIRTSGAVGDAMPAIRSTLAPIWEEAPASRFGLLRDAWRAVLRPYAGPAELLTSIAMGSLPLAATGLVGFLMYSVRTRSREIAIRLALGADPDIIRRAVVRRALFIVGAGLILGAGVGIAAGKVVASQLFMVHPADWWTMAAVAALLLAVAWLAAVLPARRAARTDPAAALHDS